MIGKNIKKLRNERKLTQEQLAEHLKISYQAISKWENGTTVPDTMMLPAIAAFFEVTIDELFKPNIVAYRSLADRYASIYEMTRNLDDFIKAEKESRKMIESGNYTNEDLRTRGVIFQFCAAACLKEAIRLFEQVLQSDCRDEAYYQTQRQLVYLKSQYNRNSENIAYYEKLVYENPDMIDNYASLIMAYQFEGQFDKAFNIVKQGLEKEPDNAMLLHFAGEISRSLGQTEDAFSYWKQSFQRDPELLANLYSIADMHEKLGDIDNAINVYKEIEQWMEDHGKDIEVEDPRREMKRLVKDNNG